MVGGSTVHTLIHVRTLRSIVKEIQICSHEKEKDMLQLAIKNFEHSTTSHITLLLD